MFATRRAVLSRSMDGLNSDMSKTTTLSRFPLSKQMESASSDVRPIGDGQLTPGQSADRMASMSNDTKTLDLHVLKDSHRSTKKNSVLLIFQVSNHIAFFVYSTCFCE
jgi:hypothetical protein